MKILQHLAIVAAMFGILTGFTVCKNGDSDNSDIIIPAGTWVGEKIGEPEVIGQNVTLNAYAKGIFTAFSSAGWKFVINTDNTVTVTLGAPGTGFLNNSGGTPLFRIVSSKNALAFQYQEFGATSWKNYKGSSLADVNIGGTGTTYNKSVQGTYSQATGKITLILTFKQESQNDTDRYSQKFEFTNS